MHKGSVLFQRVDSVALRTNANKKFAQSTPIRWQTQTDSLAPVAKVVVVRSGTDRYPFLAAAPHLDRNMSSKTPSAVVILPADNATNSMERCLDSALDAPHRDELDVVVVANGCTDDMLALANADDSPLLGWQWRRQPNMVGEVARGMGAIL